MTNSIMNFSIVFQTVALTYFCIVINILLRSSSAVEIRTESSFRRHNLTDRFTTDRLLRIHDGIDSTIHCSVLCVENPLCVSFFHSPSAAQCRLHSFVVGNITETKTDNGSIYFVLKRGIGYIGDSCVMDSDCVTGNSECRGEQCWCKAGYSFSPRLWSCDQNCTAGYGKFYSLYSRHFLNGQNRETHLNVTLTQCRYLCTSAVDFVCRTFEYGYKSEKCYLQEVTYLDFPGDWYEDVYYHEFDYYQRDCL